MRKIESLAGLAVDKLALVINCGTKWTTSLTVVAALRAMRWPLVIVDCESQDRSERHFELLADRNELVFSWMSRPLRPHGATLDNLLGETTASRVLLIDSDLEIRSPEIVLVLERAAAHPTVYGAGFLEGPKLIPASFRAPHLHGYYAERMWVPLVLLNTTAIKPLLAKRQGTFCGARYYHALSGCPRLSRSATMVYEVAGWFGKQVPRRLRSARPVFTEFDTGAIMHAALLGEGWHFSKLSDEHFNDVKHYGGVTRARLRSRLRRFAQLIGKAATHTESREEALMPDVVERLQRVYGIVLPS